MKHNEVTSLPRFDDLRCIHAIPVAAVADGGGHCNIRVRRLSGLWSTAFAFAGANANAAFVHLSFIDTGKPCH